MAADEEEEGAGALATEGDAASACSRKNKEGNDKMCEGSLQWNSALRSNANLAIFCRRSGGRGKRSRCGGVGTSSRGLLHAQREQLV